MSSTFLPAALRALLASPASVTLEAAKVHCPDYEPSNIDNQRFKTISLLADYSGLIPTNRKHIFTIKHPMMRNDIRIDIKSRMWIDTSEKGTAYGNLLFTETLPEWVDANEPTPPGFYVI